MKRKAGLIVAGLSLMTGCANLQATAHPLLTYKCYLDEMRCRLIANAASVSTAEGFPVVEASKGSLVFAPGNAESVFAGEVETLDINRMPVVSMRGQPALYGEGVVVHVNIIPGARFRKSDFVTLIVDKVFERGLR